MIACYILLNRRFAKKADLQPHHGTYIVVEVAGRPVVEDVSLHNDEFPADHAVRQLHAHEKRLEHRQLKWK